MNKEENFDYLTGLYNRKGFYELFEEQKKDGIIQVIFFDLDNFKAVNDMYGHDTGDDVLKRFAVILKDIAPDDSHIIRLGGDEFVLIILKKTTKESLSRLCEGVKDRLKREHDESSALSIISVSAGIVWNASISIGLAELLGRSDFAMYRAKEAGKDAYVFYDEYENMLLQEKEVELNAMWAIKDDSFVIRYRPVIHLFNSKLISTEVCAYWYRADKTLQNIEDVTQMLEKNGIIKETDDKVFSLVCRELKKFKKKRSIDAPVCITMSHLTLMQADIADRLVAMMEKYGIEASEIEIDIEERAFGMRSLDRIAGNLGRLKELGFTIGLTHFGEDFSSFRYLDALPVSVVKFDAGYTAENLKTDRGKKVLGSLTDLGRDMKLIMIGCGIENKDKAGLLAACGCDGVSGTLYTEPLPLGEYIEYISDNVKERSSSYIYDFKGRLCTTEGSMEGFIVGEGVEYVSGISDNWGALSFSGGEKENNLVRLPSELFTGGSSTVAMWLKPSEIQNWISAFFIRYRKGFASFMPSVTGGISIFRMHEDEKLDVWYDNIVAQIPMRGWSFISSVYDSFSESLRLYINGELASSIENVENLGEPLLVYLGGDIFQVSYRGELSALHIYDSAKTAEEIRALYESFKSEPGYHGDEEAAGYEEYLVHDPAIYEDEQFHRYYIYTTEGNGFTSADMMHWTSLGRVVKGVDKEAGKWTGSDAIWAPDIVKVGDEYRLYCSNSSWGVQRSCIFLAVADSPEGPFIPKAPVLRTDDTLPVNGIDANIIEDAATGEQYMLYGSFWGGVHLLPLDKKTGLAKDAGQDNAGVGSLRLMEGYIEGTDISSLSQEERNRRIGICLARRPLWNDGAIEGPYMIYHKDTGYYYLFVSYGSLKNDYNIRVGRSKSITGPFTDYHGRDLTDTDDRDCGVGLMISCGYKWLMGTGYMGPGHNSVLLRDNKDMFLVNHIRKQRFAEDDAGPGYLQIRKMYMTPDGWPIASSQPYMAETYPTIRDEVIPGLYERIELRPAVPQGIMHAHPMRLMEDGRLEICSVTGTWRRTGEYSLELKYGPNTEYIRIEKGLDHEAGKTTVLMSGLNSLGICTWSKKHNYL